jgi:hypothetical protein
MMMTEGKVFTVGSATVTKIDDLVLDNFTLERLLPALDKTIVEEITGPIL